MLLKRIMRKAVPRRRPLLKRLLLSLALISFVYCCWPVKFQPNAKDNTPTKLYFSHLNLTTHHPFSNSSVGDPQSDDGGDPTQCLQSEPHPLAVSASIFQRTRTIYRTMKCGPSQCKLSPLGPRVAALSRPRYKWRFIGGAHAADDDAPSEDSPLCPSFLIPEEAFPNSSLLTAQIKRLEPTWGHMARDVLQGKCSDSVRLFVGRNLCPDGVMTVTAYGELMQHSFPKSKSWADQGTIERQFASGGIWAIMTSRQVWYLHPDGGTTESSVVRVGNDGWVVTVPHPNTLVTCGRGIPQGTQVVAQGAMHFVHPLIRDDRVQRWREKVSYRTRQAQRRLPRRTRRPLHILMVMWDSVSMAMFDERALKTKDVLRHATDTRKSHEMFETKRLNTIGCCSPHNQGAWLAGFPSGKSPSCIAKEAPLDSEVWLWNEADRLNFTTFYAYEGCPTTDDHDFQVQLTADATLVGFGCSGGGPCLSGTLTKARMTARSARLFWSEHARPLVNETTGTLEVSERLFGWLHYISLHEPSGSLMQWVDDETAPEMQEMLTSGVLDDTAIVLWSDHGLGFGEHYGTAIGEYERNNPFAKILLPLWFVEAEPKATATLRGDMDRLLTPFDMHEMLRTLLRYQERAKGGGEDELQGLTPADWPKDFATDALNSTASERLGTERCWVPPRHRPQSPLLEDVERSRSCVEANIPLQYCNCIVWRDGNTSSTVAVALSQFVQSKHRAVVAGVEAKLGPGRCNDVSVSSVEQLHYALAEGMVGIAYEVVANRAQFRVLISLPRELLHEALRQESELPAAAVKELAVLLETHSTVLTMERTTPMGVKCGVEAGIEDHMCDCLISERDDLLGSA